MLTSLLCYHENIKILSWKFRGTRALGESYSLYRNSWRNFKAVQFMCEFRNEGKRISCSFPIKTLRNLHNFYDSNTFAAIVIILFGKMTKSLRLYNVAQNTQHMCAKRKQEFSIKHFLLSRSNALLFIFPSAAIITQYIFWCGFLLQRLSVWCMI